MGECIKCHDFGCNTESRSFLLPARAPLSTNVMIDTGVLTALNTTLPDKFSRNFVDNDTVGVGTFLLHTFPFSFLRTMLGVA